MPSVWPPEPSCSGVGLSGLVGHGYAQVSKSVQPVRGKTGAGIALKVSGPQKFIDQGTTLAPTGVQAYADRRSPHLHVGGGVSKDLLSHVPQHPQGFIDYVYPPIIQKYGPLTRR